MGKATEQNRGRSALVQEHLAAAAEKVDIAEGRLRSLLLAGTNASSASVAQVASASVQDLRDAAASLRAIIEIADGKQVKS